MNLILLTSLLTPKLCLLWFYCLKFPPVTEDCDDLRLFLYLNMSDDVILPPVKTKTAVWEDSYTTEEVQR